MNVVQDVKENVPVNVGGAARTPAEVNVQMAVQLLVLESVKANVEGVVRDKLIDSDVGLSNEIRQPCKIQKEKTHVSIITISYGCFETDKICIQKSDICILCSDASLYASKLCKLLQR